MRITAFILGQALSQTASPAPRPEAELGAITVIGTKTERILSSTPGTVTIKTSAVLRRALAGILRFSQVLAAMPTQKHSNPPILIKAGLLNSEVKTLLDAYLLQ